jgi:hypothetical protein
MNRRLESALNRRLVDKVLPDEASCAASIGPSTQASDYDVPGTSLKLCYTKVSTIPSSNCFAFALLT